MEKIKVGLFIDTFFPMIDGVINVVDNYAKRLKDKCEVTVFCPKGRKDFDDSKLPYKVVRCKKKFPMVGLDYDLPMPSMDRKFKEELEKSKLDIVHIHSPFSIGKIGLKYAKEHNIPVVATMHSQFKRDFKKAVGTEWFANLLLKKIMKVFNGCDILWTMNNACVNLAREYGYKGEIDIVSNATDLKNSFSEDEIKQIRTEIREKYQIKTDEKILINIGRLNKIKNLDFVIDVCSILKNKGFKFKLLLIGDGKDKKYFENKVKKLKLEENIIFVGKIASVLEKSKLFSSSDLQIFPSFYDTDGIVRIESAAFSVPTAFIENSITASTITNNVNGYIFPNDPEKFAQGILEIFENNELYNKVCKNAYDQLFKTWDNVVDKAFDGYINLINKRKK